MTKFEFIFSDRRRHRITRHVMFWVLWCLVFNLSYHYPIHVFKAWDTSGPGTANYRELGPFYFFIKTLLVNSFLAVIIPQIALTYTLFYWLMPHYYYKKKNIFLTAIMSMVVLTFFYFAAVGCKYAPVLYNTVLNTGGGGAMTIGDMMWVVMMDQVNTLPIVLGFAIMIKLVKRWWLIQKQTEQLAKEKTKAELQLLKSQVHPHFLFNTLNNIYYYTLTNSVQAPVMVKKLAGLLKYILQECDRPLVSLAKEIKMLQYYMALEKIRYAEQMRMTIDIEGDPADKLIAPLLLIPFVENSFKHGTSKMIAHPWVTLHINIENDWLRFCIKNSKPSSDKTTSPYSRFSNRQGNIGLKNVKKRLELLYQKNHELNIVSNSESFTVTLELQLKELTEQRAQKDQVNPISTYGMA